MSENLISVVMPESQEGTESVVGAWLKKVGESVREHEPIVEISTDKVMVEISSPCSGVLAEILKGANDPVNPGELLAKIRAGAVGVTDSSRSATAIESHVAAGDARPAASASAAELSPAVKRLLKDHGISASAVTGTGTGGRITHDDVLRVVTARTAKAGAVTGNATSSKKVVHSPMRRSIAEHMVTSMRTAPHVTAVYEADLSAVFADQTAKRPAFEAQGVKLTLSAYFVRAAVRALQAVPEVNSRWHDDALEMFEACHVGLATALGEEGLIVPVVHGAEKMSLLETAKAVNDLTTRARAGALTPEDVRGGTFTISNHGVSGTLFAAPIIINQPQSAILGLGKVEDRVEVVREGEKINFVAKPKCYVTLTIDHRVLDGFHANHFLSEFVAGLMAAESL